MARSRYLLSVPLAALVLAAFSAAAVGAVDMHDGKVVMVDKNKLTMSDNDGKNERSYEVASTAIISLDGKPAKLEALKKGDTVKVTTEVKDNKTVATKIEAKSAK
jgi:hypothetical protein